MSYTLCERYKGKWTCLPEREIRGVVGDVADSGRGREWEDRMGEVAGV